MKKALRGVLYTVFGAYAWLAIFCVAESIGDFACGNCRMGLFHSFVAVPFIVAMSAIGSEDRQKTVK